MNLSLSSILFGNYSNLLFILFQIITIVISFILYKKKKILLSVVLILIMNFSFSIYTILEYIESYNFLKNLYSHLVPLVNILLGIEQTVVAYIIMVGINLSGLTFVFIILKKYIKWSDFILLKN